MATDPADPALDQQDPDEDSPAEVETGDSVQDSPEPQPTETDAGPSEARIAAAQRAMHEAKAEAARLHRENEALKSRRPDLGAEDEAVSERELEYQNRIAELEWERATNVYGQEAVDAVTAAHELVTDDPTPMGMMAAYEAYHQARLTGSKAPAAAAAAAGEKPPTRAEAVQPRVDANRSDADLSQLDNQIEEAKRAGTDAGLEKGVGAMLRKAFNQG